MSTKRFILHNRGIRENALWYIRELPADKPWEVTIKRYVKPRSDNQHGYYRTLRDLVSEHTGYEKDEVHDIMRTKAGLHETVHGVEILKSTNKMNVVEMGELIEVTIRTAAQDMDLSLPPPKQVFPA